MSGADQSIADRGTRWWSSYDSGISSESIFLFMTLGIRTGRAPYDVSDLGRCLRLLALFPEWVERMPEMAAVHESWAKILPIWNALTISYDDEIGGDRAPRTYKMMQAARS